MTAWKHAELGVATARESLFTCFDEKSAAGMLAVSVHTLRRWRHENRGPKYVKFLGAKREGHGAAGRVVYRSRDLAEFLDANLVIPVDKT